MDSDKILDELYDSQLGAYVRERFLKEVHSELEHWGFDDEREWATSVQEWLRENWG
jgi:hypothetical protein